MWKFEAFLASNPGCKKAWLCAQFSKATGISFDYTKREYWAVLEACDLLVHDSATDTWSYCSQEKPIEP